MESLYPYELQPSASSAANTLRIAGVAPEVPIKAQQQTQLHQPPVMRRTHDVLAVQVERSKKRTSRIQIGRA